LLGAIFEAQTFVDREGSKSGLGVASVESAFNRAYVLCGFYDAVPRSNTRSRSSERAT
jgi:hypothetical protein